MQGDMIVGSAVRKLTAEDAAEQPEDGVYRSNNRTPNAFVIAAAIGAEALGMPELFACLQQFAAGCAVNIA